MILNKNYFWIFVVVTLIGCQSNQVKETNQKIVSSADTAVLCYSLLDQSSEIDQSLALRELKKRNVDSCLGVIAEHECPPSMKSRQVCLEERKARILSKVGGSMANHQGTEILLQGVKIGLGVLPF